MNSFTNKVVLVTGAGGEIGRKIAIQFTKRQADLVLVDMHEKNLKDTADFCKKEAAQVKILTIVADLSVKEEIKSVANKTLENFQTLDVLVNNAGISKSLSMSQTTWDCYDEIMDINLKAPFFLIKEFMPELIKTKGSVINISSLAGKIPAALDVVYCLSKAGLNHLTTVVAQENAKHKVRVNSLCPGVVDTKLTGTDENPKYVRLIAKPTQPLCGLIDPEHIATWVVWLASEESGPITGQNITVDAGHEVTRIPLDYVMPKKV